MPFLLNIVSYASVPLANLVVIFIFTEPYLSTQFIFYAISSGIFSIFIFLVFSIFSISRFFIILVFHTISLVSCGFFLVDTEFTFFLIPGVVFFGAIFDFWSTQFEVQRFSFLRIVFLLTTILSVIIGDIFIVFVLRYLFFAACIHCVSAAMFSKRIKLKHPFYYGYSTNFIYYGNLLAIPFLFNDSSVKFFYILTQISHQVILRVFDFLLRDSFSGRSPLVDTLVPVGIGIIFLIIASIEFFIFGRLWFSIIYGFSCLLYAMVFWYFIVRT